MSEKRFSVMVLPRRGSSILMQSWPNENGVTSDGFGSFYQVNENPEQIAARVLEEFDIKAQLHEVARLQYFIDKPTGLVDLKVVIYFADVIEDPKLQKQMHWFVIDEVPYSQIHPATCKWLPILMSGKIPLVATIHVRQPGNHTTGKVTKFMIE